MERTEVLDLMGQLRLFGMKNAYDEILATALKRQHEPQRFAGDLLKAEISEKQARSIKYQLTIAKLPLAKDVDGFEFKGTPMGAAGLAAGSTWQCSGVSPEAQPDGELRLFGMKNAYDEILATALITPA